MPILLDGYPGLSLPPGPGYRHMGLPLGHFSWPPHLPRLCHWIYRNFSTALVWVGTSGTQTYQTEPVPGGFEDWFTWFLPGDGPTRGTAGFHHSWAGTLPNFLAGFFCTEIPGSFHFGRDCHCPAAHLPGSGCSVSWDRTGAPSSHYHRRLRILTLPHTQN